MDAVSAPLPISMFSFTAPMLTAGGDPVALFDYTAQFYTTIKPHIDFFTHYSSILSTNLTALADSVSILSSQNLYHAHAFLSQDYTVYESLSNQYFLASREIVHLESIHQLFLTLRLEFSQHAMQLRQYSPEHLNILSAIRTLCYWEMHLQQAVASVQATSQRGGRAIASFNAFLDTNTRREERLLPLQKPQETTRPPQRPRYTPPGFFPKDSTA